MKTITKFLVLIYLAVITTLIFSCSKENQGVRVHIDNFYQSKYSEFGYYVDDKFRIEPFGYETYYNVEDTTYEYNNYIVTIINNKTLIDIGDGVKRPVINRMFYDMLNIKYTIKNNTHRNISEYYMIISLIFSDGEVENILIDGTGIAEFRNVTHSYTYNPQIENANYGKLVADIDILEFNYLSNGTKYIENE